MQVPESNLDIFLMIFSSHLAHYFLLAGLAYFIWHILLRKKFFFKKIQQRFPNPTDYRRDIFFSLCTYLVSALVGMILYDDIIRPYTSIYTDISDYGWSYYVLSFFLAVIIHDTYFYWLHRLVHHPALFKRFHRVHHISTNPSPWSAFAHHPLETILQAGIFVILAFLVPLHPSMMLIFFFFMTIHSVYAHLGWELLPKGANRHWILKWINSSVMHNFHHQKFNSNFGLYFSFWDRLAGTFDKNNDIEFDKLKHRAYHGSLAKKDKAQRGIPTAPHRSSAAS